MEDGVRLRRVGGGEVKKRNRKGVEEGSEERMRATPGGGEVEERMRATPGGGEVEERMRGSGRGRCGAGSAPARNGGEELSAHAPGEVASSLGGRSACAVEGEDLEVRVRQRWVGAGTESGGVGRAPAQFGEGGGGVRDSTKGACAQRGEGGVTRARAHSRKAEVPVRS